MKYAINPSTDFIRLHRLKESLLCCNRAVKSEISFLVKVASAVSSHIRSVFERLVGLGGMCCPRLLLLLQLARRLLLQIEDVSQQRGADASLPWCIVLFVCNRYRGVAQQLMFAKLLFY